MATRCEPAGVPGARGRRSLADVRNVGPDLQAVRLASDVRGFAVSEPVGARVVTALGEPAARELLEVLERSDAGMLVSCVNLAPAESTKGVRDDVLARRHRRRDACGGGS